MNPGHEALGLVGDMVALIEQDIGPLALAVQVSPLTRELFMRARAIMAATGGLDGTGIRRDRSDRQVAWCSLCGSYHEISGDPAEVLS